MHAQTKFKQQWWLWLLTALFVSLFIKLGFWQLHRAEEKKELQQQFNHRLHSEPVSLAQLPEHQDWRFFPVSVQGHYDNAHTILLDNKIQNHQVGYEVITPLLSKKPKLSVLINRGWIPQGPNRQTLPEIPAINDEQTVTGWIYVPLGKAFNLGAATDTKPSWPLRIESIDMPVLQQALHSELFPYLILLNPKAEQGFLRNWQPVNMPAEKHLGYALQWFTFALVLIIIFIALNLRRARVRI